MWVKMNIPLNIEDNDIYQHWRANKLENYPNKTKDLTVKINTPGQPNKQQIKNIRNICYKTNMAIYEASEAIIEDKDIPLKMGGSIGLNNIERSLTSERDGVSELTETSSGARTHYIPYSNKPLGWHTDGCYNHKNYPINGFLILREPIKNILKYSSSFTIRTFFGLFFC